MRLGKNMILGKTDTHLVGPENLEVARKALDYKAKDRQRTLEARGFSPDHANRFACLSKTLGAVANSPIIVEGNKFALSRGENRLIRKATRFVCNNYGFLTDQAIQGELEKLSDGTESDNKAIQKIRETIPDYRKVIHHVRAHVEEGMSEFAIAASQLGQALGDPVAGNLPHIEIREQTGALATVDPRL
ncbi:MAG TPA: hypothetical protein VD947_04565 [Patescibacteria group bacterium]|nr:hypothetical protein [Patescibacteria group bacterium]